MVLIDLSTDSISAMCFYYYTMVLHARDEIPPTGAIDGHVRRMGSAGWTNMVQRKKEPGIFEAQ